MPTGYEMSGLNESPMFLNWNFYGPDFSPYKENQALRMGMLDQLAQREAAARKGIEERRMAELSGLPNDATAAMERATAAYDTMRERLRGKNPHWVMTNDPEFLKASQEMARASNPAAEIRRKSEEALFKSYEAAMDRHKAGTGESVNELPLFDQNNRIVLDPSNPSRPLSMGDFREFGRNHPDWTLEGYRKTIRPNEFIPSINTFTQKVRQGFNVEGLRSWESTKLDEADPLTTLGVMVMRSGSGSSNKEALISALDKARNTLDGGAKAQLMAGYMQTPEYRVNQKAFIDENGRLDQDKLLTQVLSGKDYKPTGRIAKRFGDKDGISYADMIMLNTADEALREATGSSVNYSGAPRAKGGDGGGSERQMPNIMAMQRSLGNAKWVRTSTGDFDVAPGSTGHAETKIDIGVAYDQGSGTEYKSASVGVVQTPAPGFKERSSLFGLGVNGLPKQTSDGPVYPSANLLPPAISAALPGGMVLDTKQYDKLRNTEGVQIAQHLPQMLWAPDVLTPGVSTNPAAVTMGNLHGWNGVNYKMDADGKSTAVIPPSVNAAQALGVNGANSRPLSQIVVRVPKDAAKDLLKDIAPKELDLSSGGRPFTGKLDRQGRIIPGSMKKADPQFMREQNAKVAPMDYDSMPEEYRDALGVKESSDGKYWEVKLTVNEGDNIFMYDYSKSNPDDMSPDAVGNFPVGESGVSQNDAAIVNSSIQPR